MIIIEEMIRLYNEKHSIAAVAREFGIRPQRLIKILSSEGVIINRRHQRILELHRSGVSIREISRWLHISPQTVQNYLPEKKQTYVYKLKKYMSVHDCKFPKEQHFNDQER